MQQRQLNYLPNVKIAAAAYTVVLRHVRMQLAFILERRQRRRIRAHSIVRIRAFDSVRRRTEEKSTLARNAMTIKYIRHLALFVVLARRVEGTTKLTIFPNDTIARAEREIDDTRYLIFPEGSNVQVSETRLPQPSHYNERIIPRSGDYGLFRVNLPFA